MMKMVLRDEDGRPEEKGELMQVEMTSGRGRRMKRNGVVAENEDDEAKQVEMILASG